MNFFSASLQSLQLELEGCIIMHCNGGRGAFLFWALLVCSLRIAQLRRSACIFAQGLASETAPLSE